MNGRGAGQRVRTIDFGVSCHLVSAGILTGQGDLFCGDLLVNVTKPGIHFYIDDLPRARESVAKLKGLGVGTVCPGHGKPFTLDLLQV